MSGTDDRDERHDASQAGLPPASERTPTESESNTDPGGEAGPGPTSSPAEAEKPTADTKKGRPLDKARAESLRVRQERIAAGLSAVPDAIEKALANPQSRQLAIEGKCFDCEGGNADPGLHWRIGNCDIGPERCTLHPFRPYQHLKGAPMPKALESWGLLPPGDEEHQEDDET